MERVISLLFDIEKKANQIIERANLEKTELGNESEQEISKMETAIAEENEAKINIIVEQAEKDLEKDKQQLIDNSNKQLKELETNYQKNHDAIVEKVFQSIIAL
jgi:F0F1-type ATP synthase membrane subunit b/b'